MYNKTTYYKYHMRFGRLAIFNDQYIILVEYFW
jgi:hypothetical protein